MSGTIDWRRIQPVLEDLNDVDTLRRLFIEELNYDYVPSKDQIIEYPQSIEAVQQLSRNR